MTSGSVGYFYTGNDYLDKAKMVINATYIHRYLSTRGWSKNAIAGMLGNMETESTLNPGIWEGLSNSDPSRGFGLVQWTPSTKYTAWCSERDIDPTHMDSALARIEYEVENGLQWIQTDMYPLTFKAFKTSTATPTYLANAFLYNYERPAETPQPARGEQAEEWYKMIGGDPMTPNPPTQKEDKGLGLLLLLTATRRRF